jgi:hypothetical protein
MGSSTWESMTSRDFISQKSSSAVLWRCSKVWAFLDLAFRKMDSQASRRFSLPLEPKWISGSSCSPIAG